MANSCLKIVLPSAVDDASGLKKMEHYTGIEFTRGASDQGGVNGYHKLIGDADLIKEQRFLNMMKVCAVKDAKIIHILNQTNWFEYDTGEESVLDGTDGADIMACFPNGIYAILGGTNAEYERFIISDMAFNYDGDSSVYIPPIGLPTDHSTVLDGKQRLIRNENVPGSTEAGVGTDYDNSDYGTTNAGGYPKTATSRTQFETYARAKNGDSEYTPYLPYCNLAAELMQALLFIEFRTKNINGVLGHAISSNVSPTAATWGKVTGWRATNDEGATYIYGAFSSGFYVNGSNKSMWGIVNGYYPLLKIFDSQLSASSTGALDNVKNSDGEYVQGLSDGVMTGIYSKKFSFKIENASTSSTGDKSTWTVEAVLRQPIVRGILPRYGCLWDWISGYEVVASVDASGVVVNTLYRCNDCTKLSKSTDVSVSDSDKFDFEETYEKVGSWPAFTSSDDNWRWMKEIWSNKGVSTLLGKTFGGNMGSYENSCVYLSMNYTRGKKLRHGVLLGGNTNSGKAVLRCADTYYSLSYMHTTVASAFVCLLDN